MMKNIEKGNFDAVIDVFATNGKEMTVEDKNKLEAFLKLAQDKIKKDGGIKTIEIIKEEINEVKDKAKVVVKVVYGNGEEKSETDNYVMENGKWKYTISIK